jgi:CRISPR-associated endonuclease/helicase Cas3
LLDEELDFSEAPTADFLSAVLPANQPKNHAFLYKPVLACTIDHIIAATETTRGGKYILPCLRLLSSDLVIDEVDDFDGQDLIAIGRLIHLAGMLGRKVMISSATIPPSLAEGFFNAYQEGWKLHSAFKQQTQPIACVWVDEFKSQIETITAMTAKNAPHIIKKHIRFLLVNALSNSNNKPLNVKAILLTVRLYINKAPTTRNLQNNSIFHSFNNRLLNYINNITPLIKNRQKSLFWRGAYG